MFETAWDHEVSREWNVGVIVKISKNGDTTVSDNYRQIT